MMGMFGVSVKNRRLRRLILSCWETLRFFNQPLYSVHASAFVPRDFKVDIVSWQERTYVALSIMRSAISRLGVFSSRNTLLLAS